MVFAQNADTPLTPLTPREKQLLDRVTQLEERLAALEKAAPVSSAPVVVQPQATIVETKKPSLLEDVTVGAYFDGYYAWNTNRPLGQANALRAYDVSANSFSINQTGLIVEKAPDVSKGRRWGYRLDLMYGQATETLQGSPANEPRPFIYRPIFQAYGTYVAPIGKGLTIDFGKWASSLGFEGNYTKDQINYSRSYFFNYLPFYHMGFRTTYPVNDKLSLSYWLVNGANQTEDFNGFKSQLAQAVIKPAKNLSWTLQYYNGQDQRANPPLPTPRGRTHYIDTYASWSVNNRLTLAGELDYVVSRVSPTDPAHLITGGAAYLRYQLSPRTYFGQRYVRLNDTSGLFSGTKQSLNDVTSTFGIRMTDGFEARLEYRRDFSDTPFFPTSTPDKLKTDQNTFTLGLLWWLGNKEGAW